MADKTAYFVKRLTEDFKGDARLFRLDPPMTEFYDDDITSSTYVVVSATTVLGRPETFIFPATRSGEIRSWLEAPGSFQGGLDHVRALNDAGYAVQAGGYDW